ncbi:hypothetical protein LPKW2_03460 [Lactiplantibacillus pentosus]|nr:hypothetical protein LPKW2_03460 [Lactiplantibacillus pentosus]
MSAENHSFKNILIIIALLSLNIVEQAASVITATIPGMAKTFTNVSLVNIELITTVVSIFVTVFVLISGVIVKKIGQNKLLYWDWRLLPSVPSSQHFLTVLH